MGWDGNGAFTRTKDWTTDRDASTKILASRHDENDDELTAGIAACLTKNNETKPTADFRSNADAVYSLGSTALRWVDCWLSGVLKFKQTNFVSDISQETMTANRTHVFPDVNGQILSTGAPANLSPNGAQDFLMMRTLAGAQGWVPFGLVGLLSQFHTPASTTASGDVELATAAETAGGADATRAITPASFGANISLSGNKSTIKLPGGLMINIGQTAYSDSTTSDTFLVAFPNNIVAIVPGYLSGNISHYGPRFTAVSASGFTVCVNPGTGGAATVYWIAVGY